jgi:membrane protease subunit HflK
MLPRSLSGRKGIALIVFLTISIWMMSGVYFVQPDQLGVVQRFGAYDRTTEPGLHYRLPAPIESVQTPSVTRINRTDIGFTTIDSNQGGTHDIPEESLMLTGDENIININFTVLWRIDSARSWLFNVSNPEDTLKVVAESAMREIIGRTAIQPALTGAREQIEITARELIQSVLNTYGAGIQVAQVQLLKVDPPPQVVDAFNNVLRARQDRERLRNEAEAYRNDILGRAQGDANRTMQEAQAYSVQVVHRAEGDVQRFLSVLQSYRLAPTVVAQNLYLEAMEEVLSGLNKMIIDNSPNGWGLLPYLPLNDLQRQTFQSPSVASQSQVVQGVH